MKSAVFEWLRLLWSKSIGLIFASGVTAILYTGLLYIVNLSWMLYIETPIGKQFLSLHIIDIETIDALREGNFLVLSLEIVIAVLVVCLIFGAVSQVFSLTRYFYEGRGLLYHLIAWGIPCVVFTTVAISRTYETGLITSFFLGVVPTMALFQGCLRFTHVLLPEISTAIGGIAALVQKGLKKERRGETRYDMSLLVAYRGPRSSDLHRSTASQISNHGFCIQDPKKLASGDIIRFELKVEDDSILGEAMIKWTKDVTAADRKKYRLSRSGCRIVSMATASRAALKIFLGRHPLEGV